MPKSNHERDNGRSTTKTVTSLPPLFILFNIETTQTNTMDQQTELDANSINKLNFLLQEALAKDYSTIAVVMQELDIELKRFTISMDTIVDTAGPHDTLSALWEAHTMHTGCTSNKRGAKNVTQVVTSGTESEDPNDPLIFL
jgi:hypothetical protein